MQLYSDPVTSHYFQLPHPSTEIFTSLSVLFPSLAAWVLIKQTSFHSQFCTVYGAPYWYLDFVQIHQLYNI